MAKSQLQQTEASFSQPGRSTSPQTYHSANQKRPLPLRERISALVPSDPTNARLEGNPTPRSRGTMAAATWTKTRARLAIPSLHTECQVDIKREGSATAWADVGRSPLMTPRTASAPSAQARAARLSYIPWCPAGSMGHSQTAWATTSEATSAVASMTLRVALWRPSRPRRTRTPTCARGGAGCVTDVAA